jgi:hypothetical protein
VLSFLALALTAGALLGLGFLVQLRRGWTPFSGDFINAIVISMACPNVNRDHKEACWGWMSAFEMRCEVCISGALAPVGKPSG